MATHKPRKRFGQHFLTDSRTIERIVRDVAPTESDHIVEIGPGQRALTDALAQRSGRLTLIEIDRDLIGRLQEAYADDPSVTIINADALTVDISALGQSLRVVGNLPYNISTPLLFHLLEHLEAVQDCHFMLQKEVVDRLVARAGDKAYGRLSVMTGCRMSAEHLFDVPPEAFDPPPKVQSAVLRMQPVSSVDRRGTHAHFDRVVRQAFSLRRKTLRNALRGWVSAEQMAAAEIDPRRRPETLTIAEFDKLAELSDFSETDCAE